MKRRVSRRAFLKGALATGGLAALGAACSWLAPEGVTPTPSPSATAPATRLPLLSTPSASPSLAPTTPLTAPVSPVNSPQPQPTRTPWPAPTPAHYVRPSKLGLAVVRFSSPQIMDVIEAGQPAVVKIWGDLGPAGAVKERSPKTLVVGRVSTQLDFKTWLKQKGKDPLELASNFVNEQADQYRANTAIDYWEGFNEPLIGDVATMQPFAAFEAERVRLMAGLGLRCCVGNFGTGTPELELWQEFLPALQAAQGSGGCLALHEYSAPVMQFGYGPNQMGSAPDAGDEGWLTVRYRKVYRHFLPPELHLPLIITECGVDGLVTPRPGPDGNGWRDFADYWVQNNLAPDGETAYVDQLTWYDEELQKDDYVIGAAIFAFGTQKGDYDSYEMLGSMADHLQSYLAAHPTLGG